MYNYKLEGETILLSSSSKYAVYTQTIFPLPRESVAIKRSHFIQQNSSYLCFFQQIIKKKNSWCLYAPLYTVLKLVLNFTNTFYLNSNKIYSCFTVLQPRVPYTRPRVVKKNTKPKISLVTSKEDWKGDLCPFFGTAELYESDKEIEEVISDEEWVLEKSEDTKIVLNNALGALIGAYRSSDDSDDDIVVPEKLESDNGPPDEVKISKIEPNLPEVENKFDKVKRSRKRVRVSRGKECKKIKPNLETKASEIKPSLENKPSLDTRPKFRTVRRKITLLERLLEPDIRHERNLILQCVRHVVKNNFFDKSNDVN